MSKKTTVPRRVLLAPRKKRKRSINEARTMIQTRLHRASRHAKAANRDLNEIRDLTAEFPPGAFDADIENFFDTHDCI